MATALLTFDLTVVDPVPATASLEVLNRLACVAILDGIGKPQTPVLTQVAGKDQLQVQWSKASGQVASHKADYKFTIGDGNGIKSIVIDWGDDSEDVLILGIGATEVIDTIQHTYFIASPTITVTVLDNIEVTAIFSFPQTVPLSTDWCVGQFQIERFKETRGFHASKDRFVSDWRDFEPVKNQDDFIDFVNRNWTWGYRIRFREVTREGIITGTTDWSEFATQTPWS